MEEIRHYVFLEGKIPQKIALLPLISSQMQELN